MVAPPIIFVIMHFKLVKYHIVEIIGGLLWCVVGGCLQQFEGINSKIQATVEKPYYISRKLCVEGPCKTVIIEFITNLLYNLLYIAYVYIYI